MNKVFKNNLIHITLIKSLFFCWLNILESRITRIKVGLEIPVLKFPKFQFFYELWEPCITEQVLGLYKIAFNHHLHVITMLHRVSHCCKHFTPRLPSSVFGVGRHWTRFQQWCHSDWPGSLQYHSGSVQPSTLIPCIMHLCCAPYWSVGTLQLCFILHWYTHLRVLGVGVQDIWVLVLTVSIDLRCFTWVLLKLNT